MKNVLSIVRIMIGLITSAHYSQLQIEIKLKNYNTLSLIGAKIFHYGSSRESE